MKSNKSIKKRIKKIAYNSPIIEVDKSHFLFDYSVCGCDEILHNQLRLMELMIKKHFHVVYENCYLGIREFQYR